MNTVRDVMKPDVVTVVPEMTVRELVQTFLEEHVRGAPVLGSTGKVVGIVGETDVLRLIASAHGPVAPGASAASPCPCDFDRVRVAAIMGPVGLVLSPWDDLQRVAGIFAADGVQRVVVLEHDFLVGIVTPADLMRAVPGVDEDPPPFAGGDTRPARAGAPMAG
jgi:CBS domain-containing protein